VIVISAFPMVIVHNWFPLSPGGSPSGNIATHGVRYRFYVSINPRAENPVVGHYVYCSDHRVYDQNTIVWKVKIGAGSWQDVGSGLSGDFGSITPESPEKDNNYLTSVRWQTEVQKGSYQIKVEGKRAWWGGTGGGGEWEDWSSTHSGEVVQLEIYGIQPSGEVEIDLNETYPVSVKVQDQYGNIKGTESTTTVYWKLHPDFSQNAVLDPTSGQPGSGEGNTGVVSTTFDPNNNTGAGEYKVLGSLKEELNTDTDITQISGKIIVSSYNIEISANPTTIKPSGGCGSPYQSTITVTVTSKDTGENMPDVSVSMNAEAEQYSGGHQHNGNRPIGTFNPSSGTTNDEGKFQTTYTASKFGGTEKIKASVEGKTESVNLTVKVLNLSNFPGGTGCYLCGYTDTHPINHYCTSTTKDKIQQLGGAYKEQFNENLAINDMSLVYGGLFDYKATWDPPHSEHRVGKNADVYPTGTPTDAKWDFIKQKITDLGSSYVDESSTTSPHIHFRE